MNQQDPQPQEKPNGSPDAKAAGLRSTDAPGASASSAAPGGSKTTKAAALSPEIPKPPRPSLWARLLNKETKSGRAMRSLIRALGVIVGFYALGFFTVYTLFYQPLQRSSQAVNAEVAQLRSDLEQTQTDLDRAALTFLGVEKENQQLAEDLDKARARASILQALVQVREARLNVALNDIAAARLAVDRAEESLEASLPQLQALGVASGDTFTQLFGLVRDDLGRNTRLAEQDLERLTSELELVNESLD